MFSGKKTADKDKLRGGYYTPSLLSSYLCEWAIRNPSDRILEPSCGDGNFILSAISVLNGLASSSQNSKITAVELIAEEITKAKDRVRERHPSYQGQISWVNNDFFDFYGKETKGSYDVVIGNPPFIRFQHFDDDSREIAFSHLKNAHYRPTKLANAWAAFVQLSIELLAPAGRLAMVIPAELLQVKYAKELRERITQSFEHVILVSFKKLVFKDIQQEVVLLLAEGKREKSQQHFDIHTVEIEDENELSTTLLDKKIKHEPAKHTSKDVKWTSLFLSQSEFSVVERVIHTDGLKRLGEFANVDVGIVTGRNKFFVTDKETSNNYELKNFSVPLVGKTSAINNIDFTEDAFAEYSENNAAYLLSLKDICESTFSEGLKKYISLGEAEDVHTGYKCRIRKRWFDVPSTHLSDGFLFRQIHRFPLLVTNSARAACTDTIHRVQLKNDDIDFLQLSAAFINSLTFAWSEVCGRSYGGGVLELEPNEAEELPIPYTPEIKLDTTYISNCIKEKRIEDAMDYVDEELLVKHLNLSKSDVILLRDSWKRLSNKRINRK